MSIFGKKELALAPFLIRPNLNRRNLIRYILTKSTLVKLIFVKLILLFGFISTSTIAAEKSCSYSTYRWNTKIKKAVDVKQIKQAYSSLKSYEIDQATGCTVCEEDQVTLSVGKIKPFKVCKVFAEDLRQQLEKLISSGETINKVIGYRVGRTKGNVDSYGNRSQFSNHSFGIAIDINDEQNGLYDRCTTFGSHCRLIKGGEWNPQNNGSLTANSPIVLSMKKLGFKWGGEIKGKQKDFMHFSPSGY